jgi:restriction system protein
MLEMKITSISKDQTAWMVRAGEGAYLVEDFLKKKIIAIGWDKVGDLTKINDIDTIKKKLRDGYPQFKIGQVNNSTGQLFRFRFEFTQGHSVITYDPNNRVYWIGEITSDYEYSTSIEDYPHVRRVNWKKSISRDSLSTTSKNSLGSILTIFKISSSTVQELLEHKIYSEPNSPTTEVEIQTLETIKEDIEARATEFIKDRLTKLNWEEMQDLVAGILRGMGYKTLVSPKGADRGRDIMASPDGLGLENPKIMVEVKHRTGTMGGPEIRSFSWWIKIKR